MAFNHGEIMTDTSHNSDEALAESRSRLTKIELSVATLPEIPEKAILINEIERAKDALDAGDTTYSETLWAKIRYKISRIKWFYRILPNQYDSNILLWLKGLVLYSLTVLFVFGPCAVIVYVWKESPEPWIVKLVKDLKLAPIFDTVNGFGVNPRAYFWGLLGGSGAVVSMARRFKTIASQEGSHWLLFAQGLFNPIIGSLSAVIACHYYSSVLKASATQMPLLVIAFFAGFSERILASIGDLANEKKKGQ